MPIRQNRWLVLIAILMAFLPVVLDITILHVAIPSISNALSASGNEVLWIIDTYSLVMAGLLVPMGTLADRVGYRRLLLCGMTIFGFASILAAFSPNALTLIASRAILAIGAAMIMPTVLALIRQIFSDSKELGIAFGIWTTIGAAGAAIGPIVGGLLLEHYSWGSIFLINIPVMLVVIPLILFMLPREDIKPLGGWKIGDALILLSGLILGIYAIKSAFKEDSFLALSMVIFAISAALITLFIRRQIKAPEPMLDVTLFKNPAITVGVIMAMLVAGSIAGFELVLALELQYVLDMTPLQAGIYMLPFMIVMAIAGPIVGRVNGFIGLRATATLGMAGSAVALFGLSQADLNGSYLLISAYLGLLAASLATGLLASSLAIMGTTPPEQAGSAGSLETTGYELGAGLGITVFGVLLMSIYERNFLKMLPDAPIEATRSIGEATVLAQSHPNGEIIISTAHLAFSTAHSIVLSTVGGLIAILTVFVFFALRNRSTSANKSLLH